MKNEIKPTKEQIEIIEARNDKNIEYVVVNAKPGSGKSTNCRLTIQEILKDNPFARILYLVYNKSMQQEAERLFKKHKISEDNINIKTVHGFALTEMMKKHGSIKVDMGLSYDLFDENKCKIGYKYANYLNVVKILDEFCRSELNIKQYCKWIKQEKYNIEGFEYISDSDIATLDKLYCNMINGKRYVHNLYLKEYAMNLDSLTNYDYIFLDEAQDSTPMTLMILRKAKCFKKYIVGDINQSIYSFNGSVDAMSEILSTENAKEFKLTESHRFGEHIAKKANIISKKMKKYRGDLIGAGKNKDIDNSGNKTIIFRTNSRMFLWLCEEDNIDNQTKVSLSAIKQGKKVKEFEEVFHDFFSLLVSIYDESSLNKLREYFTLPGKTQISKKVRDIKKIATKEKMSLKSFLVEQARKGVTIDNEISRYFSFICKSSNLIKDLLKIKKALAVREYTKEYNLVTAHSSKGSEWSHVEIAEDEWFDPMCEIQEEQLNLIYVAITRAKEKLEIKSDLINILLE